MSRRTKRRGLQVESGERYALIPREMLESESYRALPSWVPRVLLAIAVQLYAVHRNGSLALPFSEAKLLGVTTQAQLYGGLRILEKADLITCTRRGRLEGGRKLPNLYALTWRPIADPAAGVTYDAGVSVCPIPSHAWARWTKPSDWQQQVRSIMDRLRGGRGTAREHVQVVATSRRSSTHGGERRRKINPVTHGGEQAAHTVGSENGANRTHGGEHGEPSTAHTPCVSSEISALGGRATPARGKVLVPLRSRGR